MNKELRFSENVISVYPKFNWIDRIVTLINITSGEKLKELIIETQILIAWFYDSASFEYQKCETHDSSISYYVSREGAVQQRLLVLNLHNH